MKTKLRTFIILALATGCILTVAQSKDKNDIRDWRFAVVREVALSEGVLPSGLNDYLVGSDATVRNMYECLAREKLCRLYRNSRFPRGAFEKALEREIFSSPECDYILGAAEKSSSALASLLKELKRKGKLPDSLWNELERAFSDFYVENYPKWNRLVSATVEQIPVEIVGVVLDRFGATPASGVEVSVVVGRNMAVTKARTDKHGYFMAKVPYKIHNYAQISIHGQKDGVYPGDSPYARSAHIHTPGKNTFMYGELSLLPLGGTIEGSVTDASTRLPIAGARVTLVQADFQQTLVPLIAGVQVQEQAEEQRIGGIKIFETDNDGNFYSQEPAGKRTFRVEKEGYLTAAFLQNLVGMQHNTPWFSLSKEGTPVDITVFSPAEQPLSHAYVYQDNDGPYIADKEGRFITSVPPGKKASFRVEAFGSEPYKFEVEPGNPFKEEIHLKPIIVEVVGKIYDFNGEPIEGAKVYSISSGEVGETDEKGVFSVGVHPIPRTILVVKKEGYVDYPSEINFFRHWANKHPIVSVGDIIMVPREYGAPSFLQPTEGAYFLRDKPRFLIFHPKYWYNAWWDSKLVIDEEENIIPFSTAKEISFVAKEPLSLGEHTATYTGNFYTIEENPQDLTASVKFNVGYPPFLKELSVSRSQITARFDEKTFSPKMRETLRLFADSQILEYTLEKDESDYILKADIESSYINIHIYAEDDKDKNFHLIW